jgi:sortase B
MRQGNEMRTRPRKKENFMEENTQDKQGQKLDLKPMRLVTPKRQNFFLRNFVPLRRDKSREKRRKIALDLSLCVSLVCLGFILWYYVAVPWMATRRTDTLEALRGVPVTQTDETAPPTADAAERARLAAAYDKLKAVNAQYVGWLMAPGAEIRLPIVQTDDNSAYLTRDFYLKKTRYGNPFVDTRNDAVQFSDTNLIIYGHSMNDGKVFGKLRDYKKIDVLRKEPILTLELREVVYRYKIIAVFNTNGTRDGDKVSKDDPGYVFRFDTPNFPTVENFAGFLRQLRQRSLFHTGVDVAPGDRLLTLQTCAYDFSDELLVVVGRLVRAGESLDVPAEGIQKNPNPRYPQALVDVYGGKNAYTRGERWYPV